MSCESPLIALKLCINPETGKVKQKIVGQHVDDNFRSLSYRYGADNLVLLPCGHCPACQAALRQEWSIRCELESYSHETSAFITLTYDEDHCPRKLIKRDLQLFIKSLRNLGIKFRYFGCGEYGTKTGRPHYHLITFGYFPKDAKFFSKLESGSYSYTSEEVSSCWKKGNVLVAEYFKETGAYVAGYVSKKLMQDVDFFENPPFLIQSNRPGLGYEYVVDHIQEIYAYDGIQLGNGYFAGVPRYVDKIAESLGVDVEFYKKKRLERANQQDQHQMLTLSICNKEELWKVKTKKYRDKLTKKRRGL